MAAELKPADRMLLECIRGEFNNQPKDERFRTGRFMTYEAVMELLREREHAKAALARIDTRIAILLEAERRQSAAGAVGINGLTEAETTATASVFGLSSAGLQASQPMCKHVPTIRCVCNNGLNCPNAAGMGGTNAR